MFEQTIKGLEQRGYLVKYFGARKLAISYIEETFQNVTIGFGGSRTLEELNLKGILAVKNKVFAPDFPEPGKNFESTAKQAMTTEYYFLSANGVSEDGIIVNMDAFGNRLSSTLYGHKKVFYIVGTNKISGTLEETILRVRNIAAPNNCIRLNKKTPCAIENARKCFDCKSLERICNSMLIHFHCPTSEEAEVILIDEQLGF